LGEQLDAVVPWLEVEDEQSEVVFVQIERNGEGESDEQLILPRVLLDFFQSHADGSIQGAARPVGHRLASPALLNDAIRRTPVPVAVVPVVALVPDQKAIPTDLIALARGVEGIAFDGLAGDALSVL
jgi:hypothetical protein